MDWFELAQDRMSIETDDEPSGFMQGGKCMGYMDKHQLVKNDSAL